MTSDHDLVEASLLALGDAYEGMATELFDVYIAGHPQFAHAFMNPEAARERMTRETIEAKVGQAAGKWGVGAAGVERLEHAEGLRHLQCRVVAEHDPAGTDAQVPCRPGDMSDQDLRRGTGQAAGRMVFRQPVAMIAQPVAGLG